ncbi:fumarylacetoacetate hydrolase family protein [Cohnella hongkongensis]|uniref:Fumarylacetoacetate hydrolase family protein n=1 Tax=Cohnella hongkongensis TaxID=178337 RepID=A0ABV9F913_9BACL
MKLCNVKIDGTVKLGIGREKDIVLVERALKHFPADGLAANLSDLLAGGEESVRKLDDYRRNLLEFGTLPDGCAIETDKAEFAPCVTNPGKLICIGLNYIKHAEESGLPVPVTPVVFSKFGNALAAHGDPIPLHGQVSGEVDYEAELGIVIGRRAKNVSRAEALSHVFGYCCVNDLSARDLQMRTSQWLLGKTLDLFCPIGPYLVTSDEVGNPNDLTIRCEVNGEVRQHSHTSDMVFPCDEIVSYLSRYMTLEPGDVIMTGTPEGVMFGYPEDKRVWLADGDVVTVEIEKLGRLTNRMVR